MGDSKKIVIPNHTAVRVALWRALHVEADPAPHVLQDSMALKLAAPGDDWRARPDMNPEWSRGYRASIVARARLIEDLVLEEYTRGVKQYVILGSGLDTFALRRPLPAKGLRIFEIDTPEMSAWKKKRLSEIGYGNVTDLNFVPVDFEAGESWREKLLSSGFDVQRPAVVGSMGVSMYLTKEANCATLREIASFAKGSAFVMSFILTLDRIDESERPNHEMVYDRARASGTPFLSFFRPEEIVAMAKEAGFREATHISRADIILKYFQMRPDGLIPGSGEELLIARV